MAKVEDARIAPSLPPFRILPRPAVSCRKIIVNRARRRSVHVEHSGRRGVAAIAQFTLARIYRAIKPETFKRGKYFSDRTDRRVFEVSIHRDSDLSYCFHLMNLHHAERYLRFAVCARTYTHTHVPGRRLIRANLRRAPVIVLPRARTSPPLCIFPLFIASGISMRLNRAFNPANTNAFAARANTKHAHARKERL